MIFFIHMKVLIPEKRHHLRLLPFYIKLQQSNFCQNNFQNNPNSKFQNNCFKNGKIHIEKQKICNNLVSM